MTTEQHAIILQRIRDCVRDVQLAVYSTGQAARYHVGKARDMVRDPKKLAVLADVTDTSAHQRLLRDLIDQIEAMDLQADDAWVNEDHDALAKARAALSDLYDKVGLRPSAYERLVRQFETPRLNEARRACALSSDDPLRRRLERLLRMSAEDFVQLVGRIAERMNQIDSDRDAFARDHRQFAETYVRSLGRDDRISLAAAFLATRRAVNYFDDRRGYKFTDYATSWIDRELARVGSE